MFGFFWIIYSNLLCIFARSYCIDAVSMCAVLIFSVSACVQSCLSPLRAGRLDWSRVPRAFSHKSVWVCRRTPDNHTSIMCLVSNRRRRAITGAWRGSRCRSLRRWKNTLLKSSSAPRVSPRGAGPTFARAANATARAPLRNHCLHTLCTVKNTSTCTLCCAPLSLIFLPLCWTSPYDVFFKICNMLDRPGSPGLTCFITWNLAGLWVYAWKRNEPPWCPVLFLYEALTSTVETTPFIKISSTFSVFNIKFIQSVDD